MNKKEMENLVRSLVERYISGQGEQKNDSSTPAVDSDRKDGAAELKVVTENEVRAAGLGGRVLATSNAIVTAAAEDLAGAWGVTIQRGNVARRLRRRVAVGADHAGFDMKQDLKVFLGTLDGIEVLDLGTHNSQTVDYPDFAQAVAEAVSSGKADLGIVVDGAGIGSAMVSNKVPGIRAAMCYDATTARNSREHNFANVLTLGGRMIDGTRMREIVKAFLETPEGEERHAARVRKIMDVERKYRRG